MLGLVAADKLVLDDMSPALDHRRRGPDPTHRPRRQHAPSRLGLEAANHDAPRPVDRELGSFGLQVYRLFTEELERDALGIRKIHRERALVPSHRSVLARRAHPAREPQAAPPLGPPLVQMPPALDVRAPVAVHRRSAPRRVFARRRLRFLLHRGRVGGAPHVDVAAALTRGQRRLGSAKARVVRFGRGGSVVGGHRHPLERGVGRRVVPWKVGAPRARDGLEIPFDAFDPDLDVHRGRRAPNHEEILAVVPIDSNVEVIVRVRPVEVAPRRVVHAQVAPSARSGRSEAAASGRDRFVRDLPVQVGRLRIPDDRRHAVFPVSPRQLARVDNRGTCAQIELRLFDARLVCHGSPFIPRSARARKRDRPPGDCLGRRMLHRERPTRDRRETGSVAPE